MELPAPLTSFNRLRSSPIGQAEIEDGCIVRIRSERGPPLGTQSDKSADEPRLRESLPENLRNPGLVLDHEEATFLIRGPAQTNPASLRHFKPQSIMRPFTPAGSS